MNYKLEIKKEDHYLYVHASGARTLKNILSIAQEILDTSIQNQVDEVLIDVRELKGKLSIFDSYSIISKEFFRIKKLKVLKRAVIVDAKDNAERLQFFEGFARKLGYNIRTFMDIDMAVKWLSIDRCFAAI